MTSEVMDLVPFRGHSSSMPNSTEVLRSIQRGPQRFVDVGHARIAHWCFGRGPDLVLVHGWPLHAATWRHVVPQLAERFTCHLIDLPSVGQSEISDATVVGLKEHAQTLRTVIRELGLERVALVGHDSGAVVTRFAAAELGERVSALVIGNSEIPGYHPWQLQAYLIAMKIPFGLQMVTQSLRLGWLRRSAAAYGGCFADGRYADGEFGDLFVKPLYSDPSVRRGQTRLLETFRWSVVDELHQVHPRLTQPTCLVWGEADPFFPTRLARPMLETFGGNAIWRGIPRGKLFAHEDFANDFAGHAQAFLTRVLDPERRAPRLS